MNRTRIERALVLGFALAMVACGGPAREARTVSLRMTGEPRSATVTIDDHVVGSLDLVRARGVALPPGVHHVSVEAPGYLPWDKEVTAETAPVVLDVKLVKVPD